MYKNLKQIFFIMITIYFLKEQLSILLSWQKQNKYFHVSLSEQVQSINNSNHPLRYKLSHFKIYSNSVSLSVVSYKSLLYADWYEREIRYHKTKKQQKSKKQNTQI